MHLKKVSTVVWSPDGEVVLSSGMSGDVLGWRESGEPMLALNSGAGLVFQISCSPDGRLIIAAGLARPLVLWDVASGEELAALEGHQGARNVAWSPDGTRLVSLGLFDEELRVWGLPPPP